MLDTTLLLGIIFLLVVFLLTYLRRNPQAEDKLRDYMFGAVVDPAAIALLGKPSLYVFIDSEVNSRNWWDFGARSSAEPNRGYLQIALEALKRTQGSDFTIQPLIGRDAVLAQLPDAPIAAKQLPPAIWRHWAIANLCAKKGGLVIDGNSVLTIGPSFYPAVKQVDSAVFGTYPAEPVVNSTAAEAPGPTPYIGWAQRAGSAPWTAAAQTWNALVARGPQAWSAAIARRMELDLFETQMRPAGIHIIRGADGSRTVEGKLKQLEDYFGRVGSPADPRLAMPPEVIFVSYDGDDLSRRYEFNWFLRLSSEQIRDSDLVWARLAGV